MNFLKSIAQGQAASRNITTGRNSLFWSLHSWKSDGCQNKKYGDSKADYLQRDPYSKPALLEESMIYAASVFKVLQSCDAGMACRKVSRHRSLVKRYVFMSQSFRCGSHKFVAFKKQHLKVRAAQIGLHSCITFRNKTLTNSNKLIHIVTLRHNSFVPVVLLLMFIVQQWHGGKSSKFCFKLQQ